jgi:hypothetical protein
MSEARRSLVEMDGMASRRGFNLDRVAFELEDGTPRRGRGKHTDEHYLQFAILYAETDATGSRRVIEDMAATLAAEGKPFSTTYVRDAVRQARLRDLLTPAPSQGKAGGSLTP